MPYSSTWCIPVVPGTSVQVLFAQNPAQNGRRDVYMHTVNLCVRYRGQRVLPITTLKATCRRLLVRWYYNAVLLIYTRSTGGTAVGKVPCISARVSITFTRYMISSVPTVVVC